MRGKGRESTSDTRRPGITPAYAGKSFNSISSKYGSRDHPRLCGEKQARYLFVILITGSPPPMRGKVKNSGVEELEDRITPAYAGKSL